ncbi:MAG: hypothetical protein H6817_03920 [Phycisphaerales bacterium]|nr:hypothetical protein [Phycisphaerales bacterium]
MDDPAQREMPDPMPEPSPDQAAMGLRKKIRSVVGFMLLLALLVVVVRGIYVVRQVQQESAQETTSQQ